MQTVDVKKLQGTRMNVSTERGTLKVKAIYAESSQVSCSSGRIQLGHIHGEEQHDLIQPIDPSFTSPPTRTPKWGWPSIENSSWGTYLHLMLEGLLFWRFPQIPNGILGELKTDVEVSAQKAAAAQTCHAFRNSLLPKVEFATANRWKSLSTWPERVQYVIHHQLVKYITTSFILFFFKGNATVENISGDTVIGKYSDSDCAMRHMWYLSAMQRLFFFIQMVRMIS